MWHKPMKECWAQELKSHVNTLLLKKTHANSVQIQEASPSVVRITPSCHNTLHCLDWICSTFLFACVQISFCFAVLSDWWRCFLNLQCVCPFACVFFLRCPLSSQGHRTVSVSVIYGTPECKHLVPFGEYFSPTQPALDWWLSPNVCV